MLSTDEYGINDYDMFFGFIGGLRASNYDITEIFVDSITKICRSDNVEELETFLDELEAIADGIDFFITVSMDISLATPRIREIPVIDSKNKYRDEPFFWSSLVFF